MESQLTPPTEPCRSQKQMVTDRYDPERDITPRFLETVTAWIEASSELFVVLRYLRAAGAKDYAFIHSSLELRQLIGVCPIRTDIIVFRDRQLPIRGIVTEKLIAESQHLIPDGAEYLCVCTAPESPGDPRLSGDMGDTHSTLIEDLWDIYESPVAVGLCPPFIGADNDGMISASKGGIDGPR